MYKHVKELYNLFKRTNNKRINSAFSILEIVWFSFKETGKKIIALSGNNRSKSSEETKVCQT